MEYIVTKTLELHTGEVGLSDEQAAPRMHNLKKIDNGLYTIVSPVQFKVGEKIFLKGRQKGHEQYLQDARAEEKAKAKAEAAAAKAEEEAQLAAAKAAEEAAKKAAEEEAAKKEGSKKTGKK